MDSAVVETKEWLQTLSEAGQDSIKGLNYVLSNYKVDSVRIASRIQFMLLKKAQ